MFLFFIVPNRFRSGAVRLMSRYLCAETFSWFYHGFSHFERRRIESEGGYPRQASLKRNLSFFMRPCLRWLKPW